ncbi:MAG: DUF3883 domain-containing protein [Bacteroidetes bacterium]|nr:DUF3883 domain-containing protein [Bacteroidota bacterium]
MLKLEHIQPDVQITGIKPAEIVRVVAVTHRSADTIAFLYKDESGNFAEANLSREDEARLEIATAGLPWTFEAPAKDFKLGIEAIRIRYAHLFDPMMAVHSSNVDPLPHQIAAVYEAMLPKQPLRFVLADDPGAGKTIMAGLLIRELLIRGETQRVLVVAPGSLSMQWQDEMREKFGLDFEIFSREKQEQSVSGNLFEEKDLLIARLDQLSRNEEYQEKLKLTHWDLVIVDEAHKMSASSFGTRINTTKRYELGVLLARLTRHFLLMTATPHNGKDDDFQLFMSLVDRERFAGRAPGNGERVDVSDLMRRMVKEELLKFDGTPLFPPRMAYTAGYELSPDERALYEAVTQYVREEMNRALKLDDKRKGNVGFALTQLQRRLASSPEAIYQSLKRRHRKLEAQLKELRKAQQGNHVAEVFNSYQTFADVPDDADDAFDELDGGDYENWADQVVNRASAAQTVQELEKEIETLRHLEEQARKVVHSEKDRKWEELSSLLQDTPEMFDATGNRRKLIIFTEHRDTLNYLQERITQLIGSRQAVVTIHGGVSRDQRRRVQEEFWHNSEVIVLVATDAAGEGVNLQKANLMVNYDLPWNPNRIEQRFGRIHRIGQREVCHLWNMLARNTREGDVFDRLFTKLEIEREALGGSVFDVLGDLFEDIPLKDLLIKAIMDGENPETRAYLDTVMDSRLDREHIREILRKHSLVAQHMSMEDLYSVKEEMEKAEARKLQPYFVRSFFLEVFETLHGDIRERERNRYEIRHVPSDVREWDKSNGKSRTPVVEKYERICFEKELLFVRNKPQAVLMHPGHPLMEAMTNLFIDRTRALLRQGTVLVDPADDGTEAGVLVMLDHKVRESATNRIASRRLQFVRIDAQGNATRAGIAPHLDLEALDPLDAGLIPDVLHADWVSPDLERLALDYARDRLATEHFREVREQRERQAERTLQAVQERMVKEISRLEDHYLALKEKEAAGKPLKGQVEKARIDVEDMYTRLNTRKRELEEMRVVASSTPLVLGAALVIPRGLLDQRKGRTQFTADAAARKKIEMIAMQCVMDAERALGFDVKDDSAENLGWDITSRPKSEGKVIHDARHIEVKGRAKGQTTVTVTHNEIFVAFNDGPRYILAIVIVDGESAEGPYYIPQPFDSEPGPDVVSWNLDLEKLLKRAVDPAQTVSSAVQ